MCHQQWDTQRQSSIITHHNRLLRQATLYLLSPSATIFHRAGQISYRLWSLSWTIHTCWTMNRLNSKIESVLRYIIISGLATRSVLGYSPQPMCFITTYFKYGLCISAHHSEFHDTKYSMTNDLPLTNSLPVLPPAWDWDWHSNFIVGICHILCP